RLLFSTGAITTSHVLPRDAEYILHARAFGQQAGSEPVKMAFVIDGKPLATFEVTALEKDPKVYEHRVKLRGGKRAFGVALLNDYYDEKGPRLDHRDRTLGVD